MRIEVVLSSYLSKFLTEASDEQHHTNSRYMEFDRPVTPKEILGLFGIPLDEVSIISYNEQRIDLETCITEDGMITIFPSLIGG